MHSKIKKSQFRKTENRKTEHVLSSSSYQRSNYYNALGYLPSPFNFFIPVKTLTPVTIHRIHLDRCSLQIILIGFFVIRYTTIVDQTFVFLKAMPGYFFQHRDFTSNCVFTNSLGVSRKKSISNTV